MQLSPPVEGFQEMPGQSCYFPRRKCQKWIAALSPSVPEVPLVIDGHNLQLAQAGNDQQNKEEMCTKIDVAGQLSSTTPSSSPIIQA